ncbi:MAG: hypothetical protein AB7U20_12575 [Planctomycetaceae bacterium]
MDLTPRGYHVDATTWFYLSLLLILAVFFRFHRVWSLRNADLALLLSASPGLLLVQSGVQRTLGFAWLFVVTGIFLVRLLLDGLFQRRPHTTQNMNPAGMGFLCGAAFLLLTMHAISEPLPDATQQTFQRADDIITRTDRTETSAPAEDTEPIESGPTGVVIGAASNILFSDLAPRVMSMMAHLGVILGLMFVGRNLFGDLQLGLAMATLYLLLPCTAYDVGQFNHVLPAALIVWAFVAYRRPVVSGSLLGLACGTLFFPLFLVPLWAAYYGRKQGGRFLLAMGIVFAALLGSYALTSSGADSFWRQTIGTFRPTVLAFEGTDGVQGFWDAGEYGSPYRIPVIVGYFLMLVALTVWPRKKSAEQLIAHSAALIVGTQFWYPQQGGVYLLWYLPILLMAVFRPRIGHLEDNAAANGVSSVTSLRGGHVGPPNRRAAGGRLHRVQLFR